MFEKKEKKSGTKVKLQLKRETLRTLSSAELGKVSGGIKDMSDDSCVSERNHGNHSFPTCVPTIIQGGF